MVAPQTEHLTLRLFCQADFDACAEVCADPEVMHYIGDGRRLPRPLTWRKPALMIGHWMLRGNGLWAAEEGASGTFAGYIGSWNPDGWPGFEPTWTLRRCIWGRGTPRRGCGRPSGPPSPNSGGHT